MAANSPRSGSCFLMTLRRKRQKEARQAETPSQAVLDG